MIQLTRVSDGAPANVDTEIEAQKLEVQGYRRVQRPGPAPIEQAAEQSTAEQPAPTGEASEQAPAEGPAVEESTPAASRRRATSS